jgi:DNA-binding transcriptional LysR family regulator
VYSNINPSIDVRLLRTTYLLLTERNVSRVATLLGHSQPAVSSCLKKAREIFADPLLVRSGQKLVLTDRGEDIKASISVMLEGLMHTLNQPDHFDPLTAQGRVRIAAGNCFGAFLIPPIGASIRQKAPGLKVEFFAPSEEIDLIGELGSGRVDIVIGNWPAPQESLKSSTLSHCEIACIVNTSHPFAEMNEMSLAAYLGADHISPTPGTSAAYSPIDGRLAQLGVRRRIAMTVPEYALIPAILSHTDLVFTTAKPYADYIAGNTPGQPLQVIAAPPEFNEMSLYILWHERAHKSPANQWLREVIRSVARRFDQSLHPVPSNTNLRAAS